MSTPLSSIRPSLGLEVVMPLLSGGRREVRHRDERDTEKPLVEHNYDWSLQYLLVVPVSSLVVSIRRS